MYGFRVASEQGLKSQSVRRFGVQSNAFLSMRMYIRMPFWLVLDSGCPALLCDKSKPLLFMDLPAYLGTPKSLGHFCVQEDLPPACIFRPHVSPLQYKPIEGSLQDKTNCGRSPSHVLKLANSVCLATDLPPIRNLKRKKDR